MTSLAIVSTERYREFEMLYFDMLKYTIELSNTNKEAFDKATQEYWTMRRKQLAKDYTRELKRLDTKNLSLDDYNDIQENFAPKNTIVDNKTFVALTKLAMIAKGVV